MGKLLRADTRKKTEGRWVECPWAPGARFLLRSSDYKPYRKALAAALRPFAVQIQAGTADETVVSRILKDKHAEFLVVDWENVDTDDGEPWSYTPDAGRQVFEDEAYSHVWDWVLRQCGDEAGYLQILEEDAQGN